MKLRWSRRATFDLERIADFIAADKPRAALDFVATVRARVAHLAEFPLLGRAGIRADTRALIVHRNYLVTYRLRADEVQVLQVWHVARDRSRGR
ncbi:MAG: type II toxin-antitoxin system RelE/ParE family toxin [Betaproteobacteria bacterium]